MENDLNKLLEENPPIKMDKLPYAPGEVLFTELSDGDKFQLLARFLGDISVYNKNVVFLTAQCVSMLKWLCEANGIDVVAKEKENTKIMKENIEKEEKLVKEKLKKAGK